MSKAYKVTKRTVMFDKQNPKTVYSVSPVNYGTLTTDDVANQIAAESSATPGDVKNVLDRYAYYVKENLKTTDPGSDPGSGSDTTDPGSGSGSDTGGEGCYERHQ